MKAFICIYLNETEREHTGTQHCTEGPLIHLSLMTIILTNDISGKIDPEQLLAQSKKGKPTMVFFNIREEYCKSEKELAKITTKFASLLLNGNIQVQNYPVSLK